jgi:virginiamycin B lyase
LLTAGPAAAGSQPAICGCESPAARRACTPGRICEFQIPAPRSPAPNYAFEIAQGPDGALWFTNRGANTIGRVTTDGVFTAYAIPTANTEVTGIAAGPDGALWFTELEANQIGRVTVGGAFTVFPIPNVKTDPGTYSSPQGICLGPDGAMWFINGGKGSGSGAVGRITTDGTFTEFPLPIADSAPFDICVGPDGALWFTELTGNKIGVLTP